uniref:Uncharacterized protein n=1 Tax=Arundo donax TaxID=35708 RepID=A0A0A9FYS4_ARUDO
MFSSYQAPSSGLLLDCVSIFSYCAHKQMSSAKWSKITMDN